MIAEQLQVQLAAMRNPVQLQASFQGQWTACLESQVQEVRSPASPPRAQEPGRSRSDIGNLPNSMAFRIIRFSLTSTRRLKQYPLLLAQNRRVDRV